MIDIVIPRNNEEEFILVAEKLGYTGLMFLYDLDAYDGWGKEFPGKVKIYKGILANSKNINNIKSKGRYKTTFVAVKSFGNDREIMERSNADIIFSFEENPRSDSFHQKISGLNQTLCTLANEKDVAIGFSLSAILNSQNKGKLLGRISQNIKLCNKYKVKMIAGSFTSNPYEMRSPHDIKSLFRVLGSNNIGFLAIK
jgi:RNase P/RNase MRP subunit p30